MKKMLLSIALAFVAPFAWGQVSQTTTTTTTTDASGTITEFSPGNHCAEGKQRAAALSLRQNRYLCDAQW